METTSCEREKDWGGWVKTKNGNVMPQGVGDNTNSNVNVECV